MYIHLYITCTIYIEYLSSVLCMYIYIYIYYIILDIYIYIYILYYYIYMYIYIYTYIYIYIYTYIFDHNSKGGGIVLFISEDFPSKLPSIEKNSIETYYVEINRQKIKWLLYCSYNANKNNGHAHLENLDKSLALYSSSYERHIIIYDLNAGSQNTYIKSFCDSFDLTNLIKEPTCFKNPENPSCIDFILLNRLRSFQNSCTLEAGLSEFYKMTFTVMKKSFQK